GGLCLAARLSLLRAGIADRTSRGSSLDSGTTPIVTRQSSDCGWVGTLRVVGHVPRPDQEIGRRTMDGTSAAWRKRSYGGKNQVGPPLAFPVGTWQAVTDHLKA